MSENDLLLKRCYELSRNPWGYVVWAYPWGKGSLKDHWPEPWQEDVLRSITKQLQEIPESGQWEKVIREAVAAGHGPGKSALIAWINEWALATMPHARVVITSNTEPQLRTKTLPEIRKWNKLSLVGHWFTITATSVFSINKESEKTWRTDLIPWSEHRPEAFAGLHNEGRRVVVLFDEASAIADSIWETTEGALTDLNTEIIFCAFGNPTRRDGYFARIFGPLRHRWNTRRVDARESKLTNKQLIAEWIADHGIDSNFVRVRVLGQHPSASSDSLIDEDWITAALGRTLPCDGTAGLLVCDVARFGEDDTCIGYRRGDTYRELEQYNGKDLMKTVGRLKHHYDEGQKEGSLMPVEFIVIDDSGLGGGVTDRLGEQNVDVRPFLGGETAFDSERFRNKRDEGWWGLREAFRTGAISLVDIDDPDTLIQELTMLTYDYHSSGAIFIETKKQSKKRLKMGSPDRGDTLAMAWAPDSFDAIMAGLS